ncbi:PP2C family protein-serine/threonine phosphatase [Streptomyces bobili]|uniref:PP2C family protein-serine/threonine phosphatase n=1 Tax=Streptomyces bobili TaxID=67280 RepID=UPI00381AB32F
MLDEMELRLSALRALRNEQKRREVEREAREQAEKDKTAIAAFASTLQRTLLPPALPVVPGLELACHYHTASVHDVGGDFYDVFPVDASRWAFFLGDVCGKGSPSATQLSCLGPDRYATPPLPLRPLPPQIALCAGQMPTEDRKALLFIGG